MTSGSTAHITFELVRVPAGERIERQEPGHETVLVIVSGACTVRAGEVRAALNRSDVFSEPAMALYVPAGVAVTIDAEIDTAIACCLGVSEPGGEVAFIGPEQVACRTVGRDTYERRVCDIIGPDVPAKHLVVGETFNQPGKWSSYPPHRHDEDRLPEEADMEEVYFFRVDPPQGFGVQRLYSPEADFDRAVVLRDGDVVAISEGYHPVAAAPGCDVYYLWVLWGQQRVLAPFDDPEFGPVKERL